MNPTPSSPASRSGLSLGRLAGVPVRIHLSLLLLLPLFALGRADHGVAGIVAGIVDDVVGVAVVLGCILFHELAHARAARRFGVTTEEIVLWPLGGVARVDRLPARASTEIWIALAGPAVSLSLGFALTVASVLVGDVADGGPRQLLSSLALANFGLGLFNLLPAFPMDGGRVLRGLLAARLSRDRATRIAVAIGRVVSVGLGLFGLLGTPMLLAVAVFVWVGASQELDRLDPANTRDGPGDSDPTARAVAHAVRCRPAEVP